MYAQFSGESVHSFPWFPKEYKASKSKNHCGKIRKWYYGMLA